MIASAGERTRIALFFSALFAALLASRLCYAGALWEPGELPLAAAVQMLQGKALYRDIWYDKPPLAAAICLLWGAQTGWLLRLAGALYALAACWMAWRFAREMWGEREGFLAAGLLGFFLIFDFPAAVIGLGPDLLLVLPQLAAVYLAWKGRPFSAGAAAGVAFLANSKAVFVLAACAVWQWRALPLLTAGFLLPNAAAVAWLWAAGALRDYYEQVWTFGFLYAAHTFVVQPLREGLVRTLNWAGFHAALLVGAAWYWARGEKERARFAIWAAISLAAVAGGWRFFPRYYLQLLPAATIMAARGAALLQASGQPRKGPVAAVLWLALIVPAVRFAPGYLRAAAGRQSADLAMDRDSREAARLVLARARPGNTLFVWGYRPDLYAYTRLPAAARFLESQPLTGVFADRHLTDATTSAPVLAERNRRELLQARPSIIVDGLSAYNPRLAIEAYPELRAWFARYRLVAQTSFTRIYALADRPLR